MTRIITLTSGSDGVGKTVIALNLAARLAAVGKRVCLLELVADASAAGSRLEVPVISTLYERCNGMTTGAPLAITLPAGFDLVTGGVGAGWLWNLSSAQRTAMVADLRSLDAYDFVLFDAGSGTAQNQLAFALASPQLWLVVTPEPASLAGAYARLKLLYAEGYAGQISVLVNKSHDPSDGLHTYDKFKGIANFYLDLQLPLAGILGAVDDTVLRGIISSDCAAHAEILSELSNLVDRLLAPHEAASPLDMATFGRRYLQAAENVNENDRDTAMTSAFFERQSDNDLQQQLDALSGRIDELIGEVERLRKTDVSDSATLIPMPAIPRKVEEERCGQACIVALANRCEQVTVQGESFAVYHLRKPGGDAQRFAFHSIDDDLEAPEPKTHRS